MKRINPIAIALAGAAAFLGAGVFAQSQTFAPAPTSAHDPGVRSGAIDAGAASNHEAADEMRKYFQNGLTRFMQVDSVSGKMPGEPGKRAGTRLQFE